MKAKTGKWTDDDLNKFVANPKGFIPGTAMGFAGIPKDSERADVIAYLHTLADKPVPLPTAAKYVVPASSDFLRKTAGLARPFSYA